MSVATSRRHVDTETADRLREDLVVAFRAADRLGLTESIDNHFSVALPGREALLVNRYGPHWSQMTVDDVVVVDRAGAVLDGHGRCDTAALTIHWAVHDARPDAAVALHTHMPHATAIACGPRGLETRLSQASMYLHGRVGTLEYGGIALGVDEGERIRHLLDRDAYVVLMRNHGVLVVGPDVATAWHRLYFLERAARNQLLAASSGDALHLVGEDVATRTAAQWRDIEADAAAGLFTAERRMQSRRRRTARSDHQQP